VDKKEFTSWWKTKDMSAELARQRKQKAAEVTQRLHKHVTDREQQIHAGGSGGSLETPWATSYAPPHRAYGALWSILSACPPS
jgi:hypothetical protein